MPRLFRAFIVAVSVLVPGGAAPAGSPSGPVVVELFQSQGCSSCPPANINLMAIADRPGVLALSFAVTYWDHLGWKDTYANPAYTRRQYDYAKGLGRPTVATPEVLIDGRVDITGLDARKLDQALVQAGPTGGGIVLAPRSISLLKGAPPARAADVWLVRYDPRIVQVAIKRGENGGKTLPHRNTVRELTRLGPWTGSAKFYALKPPADPAWKTAVLIQLAGGGPILAAAVSP